MPYGKDPSNSECDGIAVVNEETGEVMGCHDTESEADDQLAALAIAKEEGRQMKYMLTRMAAPEGAEGGSFAQRLLDDPSLPVPFVASTEGRKADGFDLRADEWDLSRYEQYGPVLWGHSWWDPAIGRGMAYIKERKLMIDVEYDPDDDFAQTIRRKAIRGMAAGSVGWDTEEERAGSVRNILMEFSNVSMPLDIDALPDLRSMRREGMLHVLSERMDKRLEGMDVRTIMEGKLDELLREDVATVKSILKQIADLEEVAATLREVLWALQNAQPVQIVTPEDIEDPLEREEAEEVEEADAADEAEGEDAEEEETPEETDGEENPSARNAWTELLTVVRSKTPEREE